MWFCLLIQASEHIKLLKKCYKQWNEWISFEFFFLKNVGKWRTYNNNNISVKVVREYMNEFKEKRPAMKLFYIYISGAD